MTSTTERFESKFKPPFLLCLLPNLNCNCGIRNQQTLSAYFDYVWYHVFYTYNICLNVYFHFSLKTKFIEFELPIAANFWRRYSITWPSLPILLVFPQRHTSLVYFWCLPTIYYRYEIVVSVFLICIKFLKIKEILR